MTSRLTEIAVDAHDPQRLATFWCAVLGYKVIDVEDGLVEIAPAEFADAWDDASTAAWRARTRTAPRAPTIVFVTVPEGKTVKNRVHLDVNPIGSQDGEVQRLLALGATHADVGQGDAHWVVLRDPEGNEFCVLRSLAP